MLGCAAPFLKQRLILATFFFQRGLNAKDMALLRGLGFNAVRLGVLWEAVQPAQGVINATYIARVKELVDELYTYGIYTIADAHQDVLTEAMCGEGTRVLHPPASHYFVSC